MNRIKFDNIFEHSINNNKNINKNSKLKVFIEIFNFKLELYESWKATIVLSIKLAIFFKTEIKVKILEHVNDVRNENKINKIEKFKNFNLKAIKVFIGQRLK